MRGILDALAAVFSFFGQSEKFRKEPLFGFHSQRVAMAKRGSVTDSYRLVRVIR